MGGDSDTVCGGGMGPVAPPARGGCMGGRGLAVDVEKDGAHVEALRRGGGESGPPSSEANAQSRSWRTANERSEMGTLRSGTSAAPSPAAAPSWIVDLGPRPLLASDMHGKLVCRHPPPLPPSHPQYLREGDGLLGEGADDALPRRPRHRQPQRRVRLCAPPHRPHGNVCGRGGGRKSGRMPKKYQHKTVARSFFVCLLRQSKYFHSGAPEMNRIETEPFFSTEKFAKISNACWLQSVEENQPRHSRGRMTTRLRLRPGARRDPRA